MPRLARREFLHAASLGMFGMSASGWFPVLADQLASNKQRRRQCILLWMTGGPTQTDYKANFDNFHLVLNSATPVRLQQFDVE